jgi:hypothetical protein
MRNHAQLLVVRVAVASILAAACFSAVAAPALGADTGTMTLQWGTSGRGGMSNGTHGWVMANAARLAARHGAKWVDVSRAVSRSSWPDTVFWDQIDHNYNWWGSHSSYYSSSWGNRFGHPQNKINYFYARTVQALKAGDKRLASTYIGYLSHYYADICQPLHTQESALEDDYTHAAYEAAVDSRMGSTNSHQDWIRDDGYQYVSNVKWFTVTTAVKTHTYYSALIKEYVYHGFDSKVRKITATSLNRAVNGLADIIASAQSDADVVSASITPASASAVVSGQPVSFAGRGKDKKHKIIAWQWRSNIDGVLSRASTFTTSTLSPGIHTIYFKVRCARGKWCKEVHVQLVVGAAGTNPLPVYRFQNLTTGGVLLTASEAEKRNIIAKLSAKYAFEGVAFAVDASSSVNDTPLYRFRFLKKAANYYTANATEEAAMASNPKSSYRLEGVALSVSLSATDTAPVYRLYSRTKGVYFWTASAAEKNSLQTTKAKKEWRFDGVAYYFAPPW